MTSPIDSANLLGAETSPYLLQHRDNPVHWMPWGDAAFARARREGKPVLLSIGYAACHWCHVMAHESFENPEIAALMNALFVNIKVDREERPDIDQLYQAALALLGQQGGWPLTMFLTADREPFWGGTYFPPVGRYDRPGFADVLLGVSETFRRQPEKVSRNTAALRESLAELAVSHSGSALSLTVVDRIAERLIREVDPFHGGIGRQPKFPQTPLFELFWRAWLRSHRIPYRFAVTTTVQKMCQGGLYDHIGGGFARYSTDQQWLVPHFEKMLYDNALLIDLLTLVWQDTREPLYAERVEETVGWVLREMLADPQGGFASSLDADSEHEEGKYYVWTEAEIDAVLGPDSALFKTAYGVTASGNWEGHTILNRNHPGADLDPEDEGRLRPLRQRLLEVRDRRVRPGWDDKVLADWNGLMIAALANAGLVFDRPDWIARAAAAFRFVQSEMCLDGRLFHSHRAGQARHPAILDDYAALARAALVLLEATGDPAYRVQAEAWVTVLDRHYWDDHQGGYYLTPDDGDRLPVRVKTVHDHPVPSGNGLMIGVLARLALLTGDNRYRDRADAVVVAFSGEIERNYFPLAAYFNNLEFLIAPVQIVIIGASDDPATIALLRAAVGVSLPDRLLIRITPGTPLPPSHPAAHKIMLGGRPTAYVCRGPICSAPVVTPADLTAQLQPV